VSNPTRRLKAQGTWRLALEGGALLLALGVAGVLIAHWFSDLFGPGTWGTGGNMVAWIICGLLAGLWLRARMQAHLAVQMAQARRHHQEKMAQAEEHHQAQLAVMRQQHNDEMNLAREHHNAVLREVRAQHEELKAHVTTTLGAAA
jgi:Na+/melibiose symporter-like transporter